MPAVGWVSWRTLFCTAGRIGGSCFMARWKQDANPFQSGLLFKNVRAAKFNGKCALWICRAAALCLIWLFGTCPGCLPVSWAGSGQRPSQLKRDQFPFSLQIEHRIPSRAGLKIRRKRMVFEEAPGDVSADRHSGEGRAVWQSASRAAWDTQVLEMHYSPWSCLV